MVLQHGLKSLCSLRIRVSALRKFAVALSSFRYPAFSLFVSLFVLARRGLCIRFSLSFSEIICQFLCSNLLQISTILYEKIPNCIKLLFGNSQFRTRLFMETLRGHFWAPFFTGSRERLTTTSQHFCEYFIH